jgi:lipid II:glycine glycyltransferase (peptidoglycan interpeptide bridge formation enzyme)
MCTADIQFILGELAHQSINRTTFHINPIVSPLWESAEPIPGVTPIPRLSHILELDGGFNTIWSEKFSSSTRRAVRKAERSHLTIEWDDTGKYIPIYYEMFMEWATRRGKQRHLPAWMVRASNRRREPLERYQLIAQAFHQACRVYIAKLGGQPIAAAIFLLYNQNAIYYRGTSLREEANLVRANDLLHSRMIEDACDAGCRFYHMGESGGVESLMRFKEGFGAQPNASHDYLIEPIPMQHFTRQVYKVVKMVEGLKN